MPVKDVQIEVSEQKQYPLLPKDVYHCQLVDVSYKEKQAWNSTEMEMKLEFIFTVIEEGEHYGHRIYRDAKPKLSKYKGGSTLYMILVGLNGGKDFTDEEILDVESIAGDKALNDLIGKQVRLTIGQKEKQTKKGEFKNVIESYLPVKKELPDFDESKVSKEPKADMHVNDIADISFDE